MAEIFQQYQHATMLEASACQGFFEVEPCQELIDVMREVIMERNEEIKKHYKSIVEADIKMRNDIRNIVGARLFGLPTKKQTPVKHLKTIEVSNKIEEVIVKIDEFHRLEVVEESLKRESRKRTEDFRIATVQIKNNEMVRETKVSDSDKIQIEATSKRPLFPKRAENRADKQPENYSKKTTSKRDITAQIQQASYPE